MKLRMIALTILVLGVLASVGAQQMPPVPPETKKLEFLVGKWKGEMVFSYAGMKMGKEIEVTFDWELDGVYLVNRLTHNMEIGIVKGVNYFAYDTKQQVYAQYSFSNAGSQPPTPSTMHGKLNGKVLTVESLATEVQRYRIIYELVSPNELRVKSIFIEKTKETVVADAVLKRSEN